MYIPLAFKEDGSVLSLLDLNGLIVCPVALEAFGGGGHSANKTLLTLEYQHRAVRKVEEEHEVWERRKIKLFNKNMVES